MEAFNSRILVRFLGFPMWEVAVFWCRLARASEGPVCVGFQGDLVSEMECNALCIIISKGKGSEPCFYISSQLNMGSRMASTGSLRHWLKGRWLAAI